MHVFSFLIRPENDLNTGAGLFLSVVAEWWARIVVPSCAPLGTIECRDAVLDPDGSKAQWPESDVVVGNPPFLGAYKMSIELGVGYVQKLRNAWPEVPGVADFVTYWFAKSWEQMTSGNLRRVGLVSTNSIRGGASREVLKPIVGKGRIFCAYSDESWTVDGAAVRVSMVCFDTVHGGYSGHFEY